MPFALPSTLVAAASLAALLQETAPPAAQPPATAAPAAPTPPVTPAEPILRGYRDSAALVAQTEALAAAHPGLVAVESIGESREGRRIAALRLGSADPATPALLIVAGLDGTHLVGSEVALLVAERLVQEHGDLLRKHRLWIVPRLNPDALEATLRGPFAQRVTVRPVDDDRDGSIDEDGPRDLNGDGLITQMRVADPPPPFVATLVADPADPRVLRAPDPAKGERATYAIFTEGIDADGDGRVAEDGLGGTDLDRNFPHRWPEFARDAGPTQLSEPESWALAQFVLAHPELVGAIVYGRNDTLVTVPDNRDMDATGRTPLLTLAADHPLYQELGKRYRELTGQSRTGAADPAGALWLWLADHRGLTAVGSNVWGRPDVPKAEVPAATPAEPPQGPQGEKPPPAAEAAKPESSPTPPAPPVAGGPPPGRGGDRPRGGRGRGGPAANAAAEAAKAEAAKVTDPDAAEWLAYVDRIRGGSGFVAWTAVEHPQFGSVEVGGFDPLIKLNPAASELPALAEKQAAFIVDWLDKLPVLEVARPQVSTLAEGIYRISTEMSNTGRLPTTSRMGVTTRVPPPIVARVSPPVERVVVGDRVRKIDVLPPGERVALEWIVRAAPDEPIEISVGNAVFGQRRFTIVGGAVTEPPPTEPTAASPAATSDAPKTEGSDAR